MPNNWMQRKVMLESSSQIKNNIATDFRTQMSDGIWVLGLESWVIGLFIFFEAHFLFVVVAVHDGDWMKACNCVCVYSSFFVSSSGNKDLTSGWGCRDRDRAVWCGNRCRQVDVCCVNLPTSREAAPGLWRLLLPSPDTEPPRERWLSPSSISLL